MNFFKKILGKEWSELEQFNQLTEKERSIVFYSEDAPSFVHFKHIIHELTEKLGYQICYVTSDQNDPILQNNNSKIKTFFIGSGSIRTKFFMELKAKILIMTMPDLETYHIKRSKVFPVHYVYIFHSINSTFRTYRHGALDHFDSIFCVGKYQIDEIRLAERIYNLKPKRLIEYGYGLLDKLQKDQNEKQLNSDLQTRDGKKRILIAPSWGETSLLETKGKKIVKILLDAGYYVTVRPHPMTIRKWPKVIEELEYEFQDNKDFRLETDISSHETLSKSFALISDFSGIAYEYAFLLERPVIYVDVPPKTKNPNYEQIKLEPLEISIRNKIGKIISPDELEKIPNLIESTYNNLDLFKLEIPKIRDNTIFNLNESGKYGAEEILKILNTMKNP